ncbi:MAG: ABC transporter substrate-binding protein [Gemmatimonadetes bacterium]|nr:ABC transporter substrate-binding protein [Gemmatimonadota bacterium]
MSTGVRGLLLFALVAAATLGCGDERLTNSQVLEADHQTGQPLGKLAGSGEFQAALVVARVMQDENPVNGVTVEFARSVSGRAARYEWSGTTDEDGQMRVEIGGDRVSGYYQARATRDGHALGKWSSIPINDGYEVTIDLPVGGTVRVTGSSLPTSGGLRGEIAIGVVLPLTTPRGLEVRYGFELARDEINASSKLGEASIALIIEDSRRSAEGAVEAFNKLIHQDGVPAILGPTLSTEAKEVFPIAQRNQVVAFSSTSSASGLSAIGDFIFRVALSVDVLVPAGVRQTREKLGYQRVATIYDRIDVFSRSSDETLSSALTENGVEILARETFETGDTTFAEQLTRIKALNPDAVFVSALSAEQSAILIQGRRLGVPPGVPFITLETTMNELRAAGAAAEGVITFTGWTRLAATPGNQAFVEDFESKYDIDASRRSAQSYAALHILAEAIATAGSADASAIRDAMTGIQDLETILGQFMFNDDGDAVYDPVVLIARGGKFEIFE